MNLTIEKIKPLIGVSVAGLGAIGCYYLYKKMKLHERIGYRRKELKIPNCYVPSVVGKYGSAVKILQERCYVQITFIPSEIFDDETTVVVKGDPANIKLAEYIIKSIIRNYEQTGVDVQKLFNKMKNSNDSEWILHRENIIKIFSDLESISTNVEEIEDVVENTVNQDLRYDWVKNVSHYNNHTQKLYSFGTDNLATVYVSAVATPNQFWVQAIDTKEHDELQRLSVELLDFYDFNSEYDHPPAYETIKVGNIYALFFLDEEIHHWQRVEVCSVGEKNEFNPIYSKIDVYFLDTGESAFYELKYLRIIPTEYLNLKFQAIECSLHNIEPLEKPWPEEAIVKFEQLTHCAYSHLLKARLEDQLNIPYLTLLDPQYDNLNINHKMVELNLAKFAI